MAYALILLVVGVALIILEILIPSGGILGILATGAIIGSIVLAFRESNAVGFTILAVALIGAPIMVIVGLRVFPKTPIGRRIVLAPSVEQPEDRGIAGVSSINYEVLLGKEGVTVSSLRPSGMAEIDGQRYSVVAEGEMIGNGEEIVVVKVEGNSLVVERKEEVEDMEHEA